MTNSDGNVEGILLIKNEATYVPFKVFSRRHITTILSLQNPFECFGLSLAINASKFILQYGDIENKNLEKATDFLISIMDMISKNYDGIGTLSDGFDIVSISENGDIFECPCLKKHDGKITINAEPSSKKVLSSFLTIQNKSETKQKQVKKLASTKTLEKIPTTIPKIVQPTDMMNIPVASHLFAVPPFQSSKCTICGKPLTAVESIFSKCSECSLKDSLQTHGIFAVPLFQNSKCSICNKPLTPVESISSKCSECSLKDSLQTHGIFDVPLFQNSKCSICNKPLTPVESISSKCSECSLKDSLQTHGIFDVPLFQSSKCTTCGKPLITITESISSKCSECSLKDSLQTHGIFDVPLFQNSKCSICNKPLTPVESISSKCSECSLKDSLQTHGIFDVPLFQRLKMHNMW